MPEGDLSQARTVKLGSVSVSNALPVTIIAGPCQLEGRDHALMVAEAAAKACDSAGLNFIFKASYDKANRTSAGGVRGLGIDAGLKVLEEVRETFDCPVLTDVHAPDQCAVAAEVVDVLQIPAFLCRQTDLLLAAGNTGKAVNIKKGQFLAPWDMVHAAAKVAGTGNEAILLTERGASFGYNTLVADMRALPIMARTGYPVVMDCTHSVQQPGGQGGSSGGQREFAPVMARAATAVGVAALFIETHEDPDRAPSDGPNMIPLHDMPDLLHHLSEFDRIAKAHPVSMAQI